MSALAELGKNHGVSAVLALALAAGGGVNVDV